MMALTILPQEALVNRYLSRNRTGANETTFVGVFETVQNNREGRVVIFELHRLHPEEYDFFVTVPYNPEEGLFRIKTDKTRVANLYPLVLINFRHGTIQFVENREDEQVRFERPLKIQYMDLTEDVFETFEPFIEY